MQRVGFVLFDGFHVITFAAMAVFEVANKTLDEPRYDLRLLSEMGGLIRSSVGALVQTEPFGVERFDTLIVAGAGETFEPSLGMLDFVRKAPEVARRVASSCIGAFTLAEAGILDGRRATTHWQHASRLQKRFPKVNVEEDRIFTEDRGVWTSAGMTASIDLMLALVENDVGIEVSRVVARKLVLHHRRAGGQSQFSALLEMEPKSDRIQIALAFARQNLNKRLGVEDLAKAANLSTRQFTRAFMAETGQSPAKAIEKLRVEAARLLIEQGRHPIEQIARETGFADRERMRRAFLRAFGQPPLAMRRNFRAEVALRSTDSRGCSACEDTTPIASRRSGGSKGGRNGVWIVIQGPYRTWKSAGSPCRTCMRPGAFRPR
jgi:transcriptional regulator GlxA family with amidase domain